MDLAEYRRSSSEKQREYSLMKLVPEKGERALDVGARDGFFSRLLATRFSQVVALDLTKPEIDTPNIECVAGNAAALDYPDGYFDLVFCAEVLEHIPPAILLTVCHELERVASKTIIIGTPYMQDLRVGRTTCQNCGAKNPPWGHVNSFDESGLKNLFKNSRLDTFDYVGSTKERSNAVSAFLLDYAGNPYGTYNQEEPCVVCEQPLGSPARRHVLQKVATRCGIISRSVTERYSGQKAKWIHAVFNKGNF